MGARAVTVINQFRSILVLVAMFIVAAWLSHAKLAPEAPLLSAANPFLSPRNLVQIISQNAMVGILAVGSTFVILTAGIDLSVGSVMLCAGVVAAGLLKTGHTGVALVVLACVGIGAGLGLVNGLMVSKLRLPSFIATLAMMVGAISIGQLYSGGSPIIVGDKMPASFQAFDAFLFAPSGNAQGAFPGIPVSGLIFFGVAFIAHIVLKKTRYGRYVYALGGGPEALRLSGVNTKLIEASVYIIAGVLAGVAALIYTARLQSGQALYGTNLELDAIAAVVIGGASLFGGIGTIGGTIVGVVFVGILINVMQLTNVNPYLQGGLRALAIVLGVLIQTQKKD
jgi:ribose/xylose/arabinose/galactoside ABC-type transport system permease subunit